MSSGEHHLATLPCYNDRVCVSVTLFPGVFITKGDVGVGTIVGSAVFNILCIIGVCGFFAGQVPNPPAEHNKQPKMSPFKYFDAHT